MGNIFVNYHQVPQIEHITPDQLYGIYTLDAHNQSEIIRFDGTHWQYYLADTGPVPHKSWTSLDECIRYVTQDLNQDFFSFTNPFDYFNAIRVLFGERLTLPRTVLFDGQPWGKLAEQMVLKAGFFVYVDTGKDFLYLTFEPSFTFAWIPEKDPTYRAMGEHLYSVQDALSKIDDLDVFIFSSLDNAKAFFSDSVNRPELTFDQRLDFSIFQTL